MRERHGAKRAKAERPGAGNTPDARLNLSRIMRGVGTPKPFSFLFRKKNTCYNERMVNNVITLLIIIGIMLLIVIAIVPVVLIGAGTLIFCFGDIIVAIVIIVLIVKLIKRIRNGKKQK